MKRYSMICLIVLLTIAMFTFMACGKKTEQLPETQEVEAIDEVIEDAPVEDVEIVEIEVVEEVE